ncbi:MAG: formyltransferase family protein, partial [Bdellovibrionota bacterium]|nr:formyltransferase family protein [Bdellovibrionota bacterium]
VGNSLGRFSDTDVLLSVSWRYLIPMEALGQFPLGGVNLHRGLLPNYPGAEPILQALKNGDEKIFITAHKMIKEIDRGEILKLYEHPINHLNSLSLDAKIKTIKKELGPHFGDLCIEVLSLQAGVWNEK